MHLLLIPLGIIFAISPVSALIALLGFGVIAALSKWDSNNAY